MSRPTASPAWIPHSEPFQTTLTRNGVIALVMGTALVALRLRQLSWPIAVLLAVWPAFGGHWIEIWYLNSLRPRIGRDRTTQIVARVIVWFVGGVVLTAGMQLTARVLGVGTPSVRLALLGGAVFIVIELVAHLGLAGRRRPSFYDGQG